MKKCIKLFLILFWLTNIDAGEIQEWHIEFYSDDNTIHKCHRDEYLEFKELLESEQTEKEYKIYMHYQMNESIHYTENYTEFRNLEYKKITEGLIKVLTIK